MRIPPLLRQIFRREPLTQQGMIVGTSMLSYAVVTPVITKFFTGKAPWLTPGQALLTTGAVAVLSLFPIHFLIPYSHRIQNTGDPARNRRGWWITTGLETAYTILGAEVLAQIFHWDFVKTFLSSLQQGPTKGYPLGVIYRRWGRRPVAATVARQGAMLAMQTNFAVVTTVASMSDREVSTLATAEVAAFNLFLGAVLARLPGEGRNRGGRSQGELLRYDPQAKQALRNLHAQTPPLVDEKGLLIPENVSTWGDLFRLLDTARGAGLTADPVTRLFQKILPRREEPLLLKEEQTPLAVLMALVWGRTPAERAKIYEEYFSIGGGLRDAVPRLYDMENPTGRKRELEGQIARVSFYFCLLRFLKESFEMETSEVKSLCFHWKQDFLGDIFFHLMRLVFPEQYSPTLPRVVTGGTILHALERRVPRAGVEERTVVPYLYPIRRELRRNRPHLRWGLPVRITMPPLRRERIDLGPQFRLMSWKEHRVSLVVGRAESGEVCKLFYGGWSESLLSELFWAEVIERMNLPAPGVEFVSGDFWLPEDRTSDSPGKRPPFAGYRMKRGFFPQDGWHIYLNKEFQGQELPRNPRLDREAAFRIRSNFLTLYATLHAYGVCQADGIQLAVNLRTGDVALIDYGGFGIFDVDLFEKGLAQGFPAKSEHDYRPPPKEGAFLRSFLNGIAERAGVSFEPLPVER